MLSFSLKAEIYNVTANVSLLTSLLVRVHRLLECAPAEEKSTQ
jgi:hypothetical protein